ncbi:hypothetical protein EDB85DRAFT_1918038 [Lactarius pseudohatsudake]|nr:hypothetical protein EDB85DRAFT_1918038 [Lactarius pseudohatsudake]
MGGKAFLSLLPDTTFPRLAPAIYASSKSSLLPRLAPLFQYVGVPREAPEKQDYGDIDFVVACPNASIGHEEIKNALGANVCIPSAQSDGRGTHNFAMRLADLVPTGANEQVTAEASDVYVQVDVNIRKDAQDWKNVMFFHAYGDLGMIMGRLAASVGLHLGELGLKVSSQALVPTYSPTFELSTSMPDITSFFGLSMDRWEAGFATQHETFEWIASSRFYVPCQISIPASRAKSRSNRSMYQAYFHWNDARAKATAAQNDDPSLEKRETNDTETCIQTIIGQEALVFFGKQEEHNALAQENERRLRVKAMWNGRKVGEWTGWSGRLVGRLMKFMRQSVGEQKIGEMTEEELKQHVLQAKETIELELAQEQQARESVQADVNVKTSDLE